MIKTLSRFLNESILLRLILTPRSVIYRLFSRVSMRLRRKADSSYFFFFIRHPAHIRLKDYGLLLLAFELSFGLGRFMMNNLTPARRNACILLGILSLFAIGPLDRLQTRRGGKLFALKAPFGFIIAALAFGFLGSFISPPVFSSLMMFLVVLCLTLHSPLLGLCAVLALLPILPPWSEIALILIGNLVRVYKRSADRTPEENISGRAFFFLLWSFLVILYVLLIPSLPEGYPLLFLLFSYSVATDATRRSSRIELFLCALIGGLLCIPNSSARIEMFILAATVFIGTLPLFAPSHASLGKDGS